MSASRLRAKCHAKHILKVYGRIQGFHKASQFLFVDFSSFILIHRVSYYTGRFHHVPVDFILIVYFSKASDNFAHLCFLFTHLLCICSMLPLKVCWCSHSKAFAGIGALLREISRASFYGFPRDIYRIDQKMKSWERWKATTAHFWYLRIYESQKTNCQQKPPSQSISSRRSSMIF